MKLIFWSAVMFACTLMFSCKSTENTNAVNNDWNQEYELVNSDTTIDLSNLFRSLFGARDELKTYHPTEKRNFDLLHTRLEVSFDMKKQHLLGKAWLKLTPYFYPDSNIVIDAKGFDIHDVRLLSNSKYDSVSYTYSGLELEIDLGKSYTRKDTFELYIQYTAKPNELPEGGSFAIQSERGLYFVDPTGQDANKPTQIWTQGETESSSCWFPTIDIPNERTTQDISITVDDIYKTLSNGLMVSSKKNSDGTRTDRWVMDQPHSPYLFMMAVGEFEITYDKWRDIELTYYLEPHFHPYAKDIFGRTPEMIEFFSAQLGIDFPWQKYAQIVVRDFVSGAMENTTATIFYDELNKTASELVDNSMDDIISHELFHHWFGDLVTCESWSNLPLNESFATYGEYLWFEYKYGREEADYQGQNDLLYYLIEALYKQEPLIRYNYHAPHDMFDIHSYQKGGRVLHMLRKYVGDEAFFSSLQLYLRQNAFQSVEIHDLRLAFEKITGEDLNWFFNQWFLREGHPRLTIAYRYDPDLDETVVVIKQQTSVEGIPYFILPLDVDVYYDGKVKRYREVIAGEETVLHYPGNPELINVDAEKMLLCEKTDLKELPSLIYQYKNAPLYLDREEAFEEITKLQSEGIKVEDFIIAALNDPHWSIREKALDFVSEGGFSEYDLSGRLILMAKNDAHAKVRAGATRQLKNWDEEEILSFLIYQMNDPSALVRNESLRGIRNTNQLEALAEADKLAKLNDLAFTLEIANVYAGFGQPKHAGYFRNQISTYPRDKGQLLDYYKEYLENCSDTSIVLDGVKTLGSVAVSSSRWSERLDAKTALDDLQQFYIVENEILGSNVYQGVISEINELLMEIISNEKDEYLKTRYLNED